MEILKAFYRVTRPGDNVFDIGAFVGLTALAFSRFAGESGTVYAFEPHPFQFAKLSKLISLGHIDNIHPFCKALSDVSGHFKLHTAADADGKLNQASTLIDKLKNEERLGKDITSFQVETETIDRICWQLNIIPQVIKIGLGHKMGHIALV